MIKSLSKTVTKYIFEIESSFANLENINLKSTNTNDMIKYQYNLVDIDNKISKTNSLITTTNTFVSTLYTILNILSLLPIPTSPFPVTVGFILKLSDSQNTLKNLLEDINAYLSIITPLLNSYVTKLDTLSASYNVIDENYQFTANNNLVSISQNQALEIYKGFYIFIKEDATGNFLKHYGIAKDSRNVEIVRTDSSHVTDTQILVDKVKLLIDKYY